MRLSLKTKYITSFIQQSKPKNLTPNDTSYLSSAQLMDAHPLKKRTIGCMLDANSVVSKSRLHYCFHIGSTVK